VARAASKQSPKRGATPKKTVRARRKRDFRALEARRRKAASLFARGKTQADVAQALGVSRQSVSRWYATWQSDGTAALRAGTPGRPRRLDATQLKVLDRELRKGAAAHGYASDLWTLKRVAKLIEELTGVSYHPGHVWWLLREQLGWTRQRPARRATERDEEAIARWVAEDWLRIKKAPGAKAPSSSSRTSRASR
jgi:transposase